MVTVAIMVAIMISIVIPIPIPIPIALSVPLMFAAMPPTMVLVPARLALLVQSTSPVICLRTALAVLANRLIEFGLSCFDLRLALCTVVSMGMRYGNKRHNHTQR
jgi:hypothetical protein